MNNMKRKDLVITNNKSGEKFKLLSFILPNNSYYLIPYDGSKYWEHNYVPRETWLLINKDFNFSNFNISEDEFKKIVIADDISYTRITKSFHDKF